MICIIMDKNIHYLKLVSCLNVKDCILKPKNLIENFSSDFTQDFKVLYSY